MLVWNLSDSWPECIEQLKYILFFKVQFQKWMLRTRHSLVIQNGMNSVFIWIGFIIFSIKNFTFLFSCLSLSFLISVNQNTRYLDYTLLTPLCDNPGISLAKKRMCLHPDLVITSLALSRIYTVALGMTRYSITLLKETLLSFS